MFVDARKRAAKKGVPFSISEDDIKIPQDCPVLGIELAVNKGCVRSNSPTLDRIVPKLGYVVGNIRVISHKANTIKSSATARELMLVAADLLSLTGTRECPH